ncbi:flagellar hook-length control protein FliK [Citrobacter sp. R56]|uniref:flagellar hook-length control protein FliK n=1 Tax=Citrobacter sp. R56 TaxID=1573676 RepID=UPI00193AFD73|nr:flagellar hook-length control protein FliK [Citrobacter sp. R56]QRG78260.1 flagellar hook-length control protein FliK [Citrobacter sp. R56]
MIQPTPGLPYGSQASPAPGSFVALSQARPGSPFRFENNMGSPAVDELMVEIEQLRKIAANEPDLLARLDDMLEALRAHDQGNKDAPARLMETVSQMWQRPPQDPAVVAQLQQVVSTLERALAAEPRSESLIAQLRGMQAMHPARLKQGTELTVGELQKQAPHQTGKLANGAPLAPLQTQALLTQPKPDSQLLSLLSTMALNSEQLSELTSQVQLRQTQPLLPVAANTMSRPMPGSGGHEFSPLTLDRQPSLWAEQMLAPLVDRLRVQNHLGVKQATLRLDPPDLGKLNLQVRTEDDRVFIQISATNPAVRDQLLQLSDRLRQDLLSGQSYSQVDVEIGQHGEQTDDRQTSDDDQHIALAAEGHDEPEARSLATTSDYHLDTYV